MAEKRFFSVILPTFSRPDEVKECLESLTRQTYPDFEVIIADGSPDDDVRPAISGFENKLCLKVIHEKYLPVSAARNRGAEAARGDWLVFLDSDCIIPPDYLQKVNDGLNREKWDIYGGPDAADPSFSPLQKAISYTMTSLFTTGGIRGKKQHVGTFHPRGFNMGMDREAFFAVNGYSTLKCGEDVDLSIRLIKSGFKSGLLSEAYVYHKRRTDFAKFYRQVYRFGAARVNLYLRHHEELKLTHLFPAVFTLLVGTFWVLFFINPIPGAFVLGGLLLYFLLIFVDSSIQNKSIHVGVLSIIAAWVQLTGYGMGFMRNAWEVFVKRNREGINL
jgi:GT2 family glycosyltransferase